MPLLHLLTVALLQGLTEFLPVSSSGHLVLLPALTGMADQGLVVDVAVHVGTLFAVVIYFREDVARALSGVVRVVRRDFCHPDAQLALGLAVATLPVVIVGLSLRLSGHEEALRSITVVAWATLIFGLVLYWADRTGAQTRDAGDWTLRDALLMGVWQMVSLIPGTSRSGMCISVARRLGYARQDAARLAMLMSIPTIAASGVLLSGDVMLRMDAAAARDAAIATVFAFIAALAALELMMRLLKSVSFTPYVIYRVVLGLVLLAIAYG